MRLSLDVYTPEVATDVYWFKLLCGAEIFQRLSVFESEGETNELLRQYYRDTFKLEYTISALFNLVEGGSPLPIHPELAEAYSFIVAFKRIYNNLTEKGKKRFIQDLRKSFQHSYGLRPFAFEITIATHFLRTGCDVTFVDVEGLGRFEYLVEKDGQKLEIECKAISNDAGRVIDRKGLCKVGTKLLPVIEAALDQEPKVLNIKVEMHPIV